MSDFSVPDIPGIGLCAEHGFYFKVPAINGDHWSCVSQRCEDFTWKDIAMELMKQYVKRTQGAFIENKVKGNQDQVLRATCLALFILARSQMLSSLISREARWCFNIEMPIQISGHGKRRNYQTTWSK